MLGISGVLSCLGSLEHKEYLIDLLAARVRKAFFHTLPDEAALLQDPDGAWVVRRRAGVDGPDPVEGEELGQRRGRDPTAPEFPVDPVGDLRLIEHVEFSHAAHHTSLQDDRFHEHRGIG